MALAVVAVSLGLSNFAASVALGVSGVDRALRLRVAVVFGLFEAAMPIVGLLLGHRVAHTVGGAAKPLGGALLGVTGLYAFVSAMTISRVEPRRSIGNARLLVSGLALSIDNLVVGFALGAYRVSFPVAAAVIGVVSVTLSLLGLELGERLGTRFGERAELLGGLALVAVGVAIGFGAL